MGSKRRQSGWSTRNNARQTNLLLHTWYSQLHLHCMCVCVYGCSWGSSLTTYWSSWGERKASFFDSGRYITAAAPTLSAPPSNSNIPTPERSLFFLVIAHSPSKSNPKSGWAAILPGPITSRRASYRLAGSSGSSPLLPLLHSRSLLMNIRSSASTTITWPLCIKTRFPSFYARPGINKQVKEYQDIRWRSLQSGPKFLTQWDAAGGIGWILIWRRAPG